MAEKTIKPGPEERGEGQLDLFATQLQETGRVVGHRGDEQAIARAIDTLGIERFEVRVVATSAPDTGATVEVEGRDGVVHRVYDLSAVVCAHPGCGLPEHLHGAPPGELPNPTRSTHRFTPASDTEERLRAALDVDVLAKALHEAVIGCATVEDIGGECVGPSEHVSDAGYIITQLPIRNLDADRLARAIHSSNEHPNLPGCLDMDRQTATDLIIEYSSGGSVDEEAGDG